MPRPRALTPAQESELMRRYALWRDNTPKRIAADLRVSRRTINSTVDRVYKAVGRR